MFRSIIVATILILSGTAQLAAQAPPTTNKSRKIPVAFNCQCSDFVGAHYEKALRQLLVQNPEYQVTNTAQTTNKRGKVVSRNWHISVMSLDPSPTNNGQYAALSIVFLLGDDDFMMQDVQYCSRAKVATCAHSTLATFGKLLKMMGQ